MKTFIELGFEKEYTSPRTLRYNNDNHKDRGRIFVDFKLNRKTWEVAGWADGDAEIAAAILIECIKLGWMEVPVCQ